MRPAGNENWVHQPLSCCFWLSAQEAVVFTHTQGQSSVTNNTAQHRQPHHPKPGQGAGQSQQEGSTAGKDGQPQNIQTRGRSWASGCAQSLSCAGDGVRASKVDTCVFGFVVAGNLAPWLVTRFFPTLEASLLDLKSAQFFRKTPMRRGSSSVRAGGRLGAISQLPAVGLRH